ncbi:hypothetical protein AB0L63_32620 [Nocardia sp. NPDC051990]|uniref:hypothetical protein n=1 Tax=Nocardia sp. NPDC051990 TaxID=3155285 RepID=UPI00343E2D60
MLQEVGVLVDTPSGHKIVAFMPSKHWLMANGPQVPTWRNEVTLSSIDKFQSYAPEAFLRRVSPTPLHHQRDDARRLLGPIQPTPQGHCATGEFDINTHRSSSHCIRLVINVRPGSSAVEGFSVPFVRSAFEQLRGQCCWQIA